jgi:hypothetical protein
MNTSVAVERLIENIEVKATKSGGALLRINDKDNFVSIWLDDQGDIEKLFIDAPSLSDKPMIKQATS